MTRYLFFPALAAAAAGLLLLLGGSTITAPQARGDESYDKVAEEVNKKCVKLFGAGGIRGLVSYGTGVLISKAGRIMTTNSHMLETRDLRIHTWDGTRYHGKVICREPELDIAIVEIEHAGVPPKMAAWFDFEAALKKGPMKPGTQVLAFSNMFQLGLRDDTMTVQHGTISSYSPLYGRIGVFDSTYRGNVYVLDAITNNPGSGGGVITTRKGELVGIIGRELRNELTNTWINFAIPLDASAEAVGKKGEKFKTNIAKLVHEGIKYNPIPKLDKKESVVVHGIILVPDVVERTPPYIEEVLPGSPAAKAKPELKPDDLIVYVDGVPVPDITTFNEVLAQHKPGDEIKLEVQRGDSLTTVPLKLEKRKDKDSTPPKK
jgi:serine protease Do